MHKGIKAVCGRGGSRAERDEAVRIVPHVRRRHAVGRLLGEIAVVVVAVCGGGEAVRYLSHRVWVRVAGTCVRVRTLIQWHDSEHKRIIPL